MAGPWSTPQVFKFCEIAGKVSTTRVNRLFCTLLNIYRRGKWSRAGMKLAIERGWHVMHESGTYVKFTPAGADLFA